MGLMNLLNDGSFAVPRLPLSEKQYVTARKWPWVVVYGHEDCECITHEAKHAEVHSLHRTYQASIDVVRGNPEHLSIGQTHDFVEAGGNVVGT